MFFLTIVVSAQAQTLALITAEAVNTRNQATVKSPLAGKVDLAEVYPILQVQAQASNVYGQTAEGCEAFPWVQIELKNKQKVWIYGKFVATFTAESKLGDWEYPNIWIASSLHAEDCEERFQLPFIYDEKIIKAQLFHNRTRLSPHFPHHYQMHSYRGMYWLLKNNTAIIQKLAADLERTRIELPPREYQYQLTLTLNTTHGEEHYSTNVIIDLTHRYQKYAEGIVLSHRDEIQQKAIIKERVLIVAEDVNVRAEPTVNSKKLGQLKIATLLPLLEMTDNNLKPDGTVAQLEIDCGYKWLKIQLADKKEAWVYGKFAHIIDPLESYLSFTSTLDKKIYHLHKGKIPAEIALTCLGQYELPVIVNTSYDKAWLLTDITSIKNIQTDCSTMKIPPCALEINHCRGNFWCDRSKYAIEGYLGRAASDTKPKVWWYVAKMDALSRNLVEIIHAAANDFRIQVIKQECLRRLQD